MVAGTFFSSVSVPAVDLWARKVVQLRASADANSRMQLLARKSTAGTLTDAEREEYDACVSAGTFIAFLQAKARRMLGRNGAA